MPGVTDYVAPTHQEVNILCLYHIHYSLTVHLLLQMLVLQLFVHLLKNSLEESILRINSFLF